MPRLHLFEFNDQPWLPGWIRQYLTDYLETLIRRLNLFAPAVPIFADLLRQTGERQLVDFGSGSGGPPVSLAGAVADELGEPIQWVLTDKFPHETAVAHIAQETDGRCRYIAEPVDLFAVPDELTGVRTMFDVLHHFRPDDVKKLLQNAVAANAPIACFELVSRKAPSVIGSVLIPLFVWLVTPLIRPFSWRRLLFTYLIPILPLLITWDGMVSHLRGYHGHELAALADQLDAPGYTWQADEIQIGTSWITYLVGVPE